jgi:hypothetical protein
VAMAAAGTPVWKIVVIVLIVVFIAIPLLAFLAQRAISPGSATERLDGTVIQQTESTPSTPP